MIESILVVAGQVFMLFLMMSVGYIGSKTGLFTSAGADQFSKISLNVVTPCLIINSLQREKDAQLFSSLAISIVAGIVFISLGIIISKFILSKFDNDSKRVLRFGTSFPNCGYMGVPLVQAVLGDTAVIYAAGIVIAFNIMQWTFGIAVIGGKDEISLKKAILNPGIISFIIAFFLFGFEIKLPSLIGNAVNMFADMNTPIAMIAIGIFMASTDLKKCFTQGRIYIVCAIRLILIPLIILLAFSLFNLDILLYSTIVICSSAPVAASTSMFSSRYNLDTGLASQTVTACTLLSIITMPVFAGLASLLA